MNLPFLIAKRYLISKKKQNIINIISGISLSGVIVGTMAIIIIVSVMNGFTQLIGVFYSDFDPDLKIIPAEGKMFGTDAIDKEKIESISGVLSYSEIIEGVAMLKYGRRQYPATVKGVPANYTEYSNIHKRIVKGEYFFEKNGLDYAVIGRGIANYLGTGISFLDPIHLIVPKKGRQISLNPARSFNTDQVYPSAEFAILEDVDSKYILVSYEFASQLFDSKNTISSVEIDLADDADLEEIQDIVSNIVGDAFHVKNREQQRDLVFKTMKSEKLWVFIILVFILILASGNMIGNLTMLYLDKKEDISILRSMGLTVKKINRIFLYEGWLISFIGGIIGTLLGILMCWLQIRFELIKLPGSGSFVISAYPVQIIYTDVILAFLAVLTIGFLASWYPVKFMANNNITESNIT